MAYKTDTSSASERLKQARLAAGFKSAQSAAAIMGMNPVTVRAHETGQNGFSPAAAATYARVYNVSVEWLLLGEEGSTPNLGETAALAMRAAKSEAAVKHVRATLLKLVADLDAIG